MKRYLIPILLTVLLIPGVLVSGCGFIRVSPEITPKEELRVFGSAVLKVEDDRDDLIGEYQSFTKVFLDMSTQAVFERAKYFVETHTELRKRILSIETPNLEIKEVHNKYVLAYAAENQAYLKVQAFLVSADEEELYDSMKLFSEADIIFLEAIDKLDELLSNYGLEWSDIR